MIRVNFLEVHNVVIPTFQIWKLRPRLIYSGSLPILNSVLSLCISIKCIGPVHYYLTSLISVKRVLLPFPWTKCIKPPDSYRLLLYRLNPIANLFPLMLSFKNKNVLGNKLY